MPVYFIRMIILFLSGALLAGCAGGTAPVTTDKLGVRAVSLSAGQKKIVFAGVQQMLDREKMSGKSARLSEIRSFRRKGAGDGIHVCGQVRYREMDGKAVKSLKEAPFYIELAPETLRQGHKGEGRIVRISTAAAKQGRGASKAGEARRGQIGFDKVRKGKVRFVCR